MLHIQLPNPNDELPKSVNSQASPIKKNIGHWPLDISHFKKGFTLIELLVVITIIAILATIAITVYTSTQKTARISKRLQDLKALQESIVNYQAANGFFPKSAAATTCLNTITFAPVFAPTYIPSIPNDPAGGTNCYMYRSDANGTEYKVWLGNSSAATGNVNSEMTATEFQVQPDMIDPQRDATAGDCVVQTTGATKAWAIYSSLGTAAGTNACGF